MKAHRQLVQCGTGGLLLLLLLLLLVSWRSSVAVASVGTATTTLRFPTPRAAAQQFFENRRWRLRRTKTEPEERNVFGNGNGNPPTREQPCVIVQEPDGMIDRDHILEGSETTTSKFWPPWPFSMLSNQDKDNEEKDQSRAGDETMTGSPASTTTADDRRRRPNITRYKKKPVDYSALAHFWSISKRSATVAARNVQEVGSQLWYHLPPGAPPLLLLASWPHRVPIIVTVTDAVASSTTAAAAAVPVVGHKTVVPLLSNPFVRSLAFSAATLAFVSWGHAELRRKRRLTPLPLPERYRDINRAVLPPFLTEAAEAPTVLASSSSSSYYSLPSSLSEPDDDTAEEGEEEGEEQESLFLPPRLRRYWKDFVGNNNNKPRRMSLPTAWRDWQNMRLVRQCERNNAHRLAIYDELVTLQALKNNKNKKSSSHHQPHRRNNNNKTGASSTTTGSSGNGSSSNTPSDGLGYALVTGASKGIGRALAVELARWEIPLILVARDADALAALATDLETCYGISCYVLPADLANDGTAQRLYQTVQTAGLKVDFLINNAGIAAHGDVLDHSLEALDQIVQVNARSLLALTHLFGRDMREQRRGRVLMVSSVCGAVSGIASVAVYSATKAFANSFAIALAKEMEPYGVGVTCLVPGAVRGTDFSSQSQSQEALCWKLPFYSKSAEAVAEAGVRAMLHGDVEVTPGIMNRLYLKVAKPMAPQRLHNLIAEVVWKPIAVPQWLGPIRSRMISDGSETVSSSSHHEQHSPLETTKATTTTRRKPLQVRPAGLIYHGLPESRMLELAMPIVSDPAPSLQFTTAEEATIIDGSGMATATFHAGETHTNHGLGNQTEFSAPTLTIDIIQDHPAAIEPVTTLEDLFDNQTTIEPSLGDTTVIRSTKVDEPPSSTLPPDHPREQKETDVKAEVEPAQIQTHQDRAETPNSSARHTPTMPTSRGGVLESPTRETNPGLHLEQNSTSNETSELERLLDQYQRQRSIHNDDLLGLSLLNHPSG